MIRKAYLPLEKIGPRHLVTYDSMAGMPVGMNREDEVALPPWSATPRAPDPNKNNPDVYEPRYAATYYNTPDGTVDVEERSRTLPSPGDQSFEGDRVEFDHFNDASDHFTRRSIQGDSYKPRKPWRKQTRQPLNDRSEDAQYYRKDKSTLKRKALRRYERVKDDRRFVEMRQDRRKDPDKYERKKLAEEVVLAYTPTSLSTRRRKQRGPAKVKRHRSYMKNRSKTRARQKRWYHKNKNKPGFKRRVKVRKNNPNKYRLRYASSEVSFFIGPEMTPGVIDRLSATRVGFTLEDGTSYDVSPRLFVASVMFSDISSSEAFFDVLEEEGCDIHDDLSPDETDFVSDLYGDAVSCWDDAARVVEAAADIVFAGDVHLYDQESQGDWEMPEDAPQSSPSGPGIYESKPSEGAPQRGVDSDRGLALPGSSAMIIPDHLKYAATRSDLIKSAPPAVVMAANLINVSQPTLSGLTYTFDVDGKYITKIQEKRGRVRVTCSCKFFQYQGPEHWALVEGYLIGKPQGTATIPKEKDPDGVNKICKHVLACLLKL